VEEGGGDHKMGEMNFVSVEFDAEVSRENIKSGNFKDYQGKPIGSSENIKVSGNSLLRQIKDYVFDKGDFWNTDGITRLEDAIYFHNGIGYCCPKDDVAPMKSVNLLLTNNYAMRGLPRV